MDLCLFGYGSTTSVSVVVSLLLLEFPTVHNSLRIQKFSLFLVATFCAYDSFLSLPQLQFNSFNVPILDHGLFSPEGFSLNFTLSNDSHPSDLLFFGAHRAGFMSYCLYSVFLSHAGKTSHGLIFRFAAAGTLAVLSSHRQFYLNRDGLTGAAKSASQ
ncbi:hypothetical protein C8R45DRAFT_1109561 [Mycena sanguinolenta]|nr:hypothetical protein C8R45DRAFT_1109561 [Mycena sanguinolenta]